MPERDNVDFAEFGRLVLHSYRELIDLGIDTPLPEDELISDVLSDLMHYCSLHGVDFDQALETARLTYAGERAEEGVFALDSLVQLTGEATREAERAQLPVRGTVANVLPAEDGGRDYLVRFPGASRNDRLRADQLEPAPPFRAVGTSKGPVVDPVRAERVLANAAASMLSATEHGQLPDRERVADFNALLPALAEWSGLTEERMAEVLAPKFKAAADALKLPSGPLSTHPARLAAEGFPSSPEPADDPTVSTTRPKTAKPRPTQQHNAPR
ncbi:hypothetical protein GCM10009678_66400 [Actinomadura kijaniata]|uniref:Uncharacterized protein n=1 Tax=Actinomadura namibiensis TaxID=182080 RepID=A0A7W3LYJ6_ACTNM|nr:hypothetical protein [Actinomadura namibiensis]MBA8956542.1 hypothetical protein [Actinomadura namibiensis]